MRRLVNAATGCRRHSRVCSSPVNQVCEPLTYESTGAPSRWSSDADQLGGHPPERGRDEHGPQARPVGREGGPAAGATFPLSALPGRATRPAAGRRPSRFTLRSRYRPPIPRGTVRTMRRAWVGGAVAAGLLLVACGGGGGLSKAELRRAGERRLPGRGPERGRARCQAGPTCEQLPQAAAEVVEVQRKALDKLRAIKAPKRGPHRDREVDRARRPDDRPGRGVGAVAAATVTSPER